MDSSCKVITRENRQSIKKNHWNSTQSGGALISIPPVVLILLLLLQLKSSTRCHFHKKLSCEHDKNCELNVKGNDGVNSLENQSNKYEDREGYRCSDGVKGKPTLFHPAPGFSALNRYNHLDWMGPWVAEVLPTMVPMLLLQPYNHLMLGNTSCWGVRGEGRGPECLINVSMAVALVLKVAGMMGRVWWVCGSPTFLEPWYDKSTKALSDCFFLPPS